MNFQFLEYHIVSKTLIFWSLFMLLLNRNKALSNINWKSFLPYLWLLPLFLSIIYSSNYNYGLKRVINYLPLFIIPFIYELSSDYYRIKTYNFVRNIFPVSVILFGLFIIIKLCYYFYQPYIVQYGTPSFSEYLIFVYEHRFGYLVNKDEIEVFSQDFHKAYYSVSVLISIILVRTWKYKFLKILATIILVLLLLVFKSIPAYITLIVTLMIFTLWKNKTHLYTVGLILVILISICIFFIEREFILNLLDLRYYSYSCFQNLFFSEPLLGFGVGDVNSELLNCYQEKGCIGCNNLNSHNEYLNMALSSGLIGLISFLMFLYYSYRKATKNISFFAFLTIFCISFMFENVLSRMWGVLMFSFFYGVFKYASNQKN